MSEPRGFYRRIVRAYIVRLRVENRKLRDRNKELEVMAFALNRRERQIAEIERLLIARAQHYDPQNPRVRHKIIRMRKQLLEHVNG